MKVLSPLGFTSMGTGCSEYYCVCTYNRCDGGRPGHVCTYIIIVYTDFAAMECRDWADVIDSCVLRRLAELWIGRTRSDLGRICNHWVRHARYVVVVVNDRSNVPGVLELEPWRIDIHVACSYLIGSGCGTVIGGLMMILLLAANRIIKKMPHESLQI